MVEAEWAHVREDPARLKRYVDQANQVESAVEKRSRELSCDVAMPSRVASGLAVASAPLPHGRAAPIDNSLCAPRDLSCLHAVQPEVATTIDELSYPLSQGTVRGLKFAMSNAKLQIMRDHMPRRSIDDKFRHCQSHVASSGAQVSRSTFKLPRWKETPNRRYKFRSSIEQTLEKYCIAAALPHKPAVVYKAKLLLKIQVRFGDPPTDDCRTIWVAARNGNSQAGVVPFRLMFFRLRHIIR